MSNEITDTNALPSSLPDAVNQLLTTGRCDRIDEKSLEALQSITEGIQKQMIIQQTLARHTSPITQLPDGSWYTRINGKKYQRKSREKLVDAIVSAYVEDRYVEDGPTIRSIFNDFLSVRKKQVSPTTWSKDIFYYERYISNSKLARIPLTKIRPRDGYDFLDHCQSIYPEMHRKYWNNIWVTVRQIIHYAVWDGLIYVDPFTSLKIARDYFKPRTVHREEDTVFSREERRAVVSIAEQDADEKKSCEPLGIVLLFQTGIRDGELCALKWMDLERGRRTGSMNLHIQRELVAAVSDSGKARGVKVVSHCKTNAGDRRIELNTKAMETLQKIKEYNQLNGIPVGEDDFIFMRWHKSELVHCSSRSFDPRLRRYCRKAGMRTEKSPHDVRRTVLTDLFRAGVPLKTIQRYAGHASLKQTLDYLRFTDDEDDNIHQALEGFNQ